MCLLVKLQLVKLRVASDELLCLTRCACATNNSQVGGRPRPGGTLSWRNTVRKAPKRQCCPNGLLEAKDEQTNAGRGSDGGCVGFGRQRTGLTPWGTFRCTTSVRCFAGGKFERPRMAASCHSAESDAIRQKSSDQVPIPEKP